MSDWQNDPTDMFKYYMGKESPLNGVGKIIAFPLVLISCIVFFVWETLFCKRNRKET